MNVHQENLARFLKTAEMLKIRGLAEDSEKVRLGGEMGEGRLVWSAGGKGCAAEFEYGSQRSSSCSGNCSRRRELEFMV